VKEIASGVNDSRPTLLSLLKDTGARLRSRVLAENDKEDLIADLVAIVYAFTARLYGQRRAKRKTARIVLSMARNASGRWILVTGRHHDAPGGAAYHQQK